MSIQNPHRSHQAFTHMPMISNNRGWALTITSIPDTQLADQSIHASATQSKVELGKHFVTTIQVLERLKAGKEVELHDLYTNWTIESD